jgi:hypothetical protein
MASRAWTEILGADELVLLVPFGVTGRQLEVEVVEAEVAEQGQDEVEQVLDLARRLVAGDVRVGVVLRHPPHAGQTVHDTRLLVAVDGAELEEAQRQLAIGPTPRAVDQVVHRAVHRLEAVLATLELHGREHRVGVVRQVARGVEQPVLGDVGRADVVEALLDVPATDVVLHLALDHPTLGMEDGQARAQLVGEAVEVELETELAVVAPLGLREAVEVGLELVLGRPRRAVDPLELGVLLGAAPVGGRGAHQLERVADELGARDVRTAAQVAPGEAAVTAQVVVDGELSPTDLDHGALRRVSGAALEAHELALVRLVGQLTQRLLVRHDPPGEGLALVDDLLHGLFEGLEVIGVERGLDVEVVVEAVADRGTDPELRLGVDRLHRLGQDVSRRVAQDREPVRRVDADRLDGVSVGEHVEQVPQLPVDAGDDDVAAGAPDLLEQLTRRRLLRNRSLAPGDGDGDLCRHGGHSSCA